MLSLPSLHRLFFVGAKVKAVRKISKFGKYTGTEILHFASLHSE